MKTILILIINYFIAWTIAYVIVYQEYFYDIYFTNYFSDLVKVWTGNAFVFAAWVQIIAIIIFSILTIIYFLVVYLKKRNK